MRPDGSGAKKAPSPIATLAVAVSVIVVSAAAVIFIDNLKLRRDNLIQGKMLENAAREIKTLQEKAVQSDAEASALRTQRDLYIATIDTLAGKEGE